MKRRGLTLEAVAEAAAMEADAHGLEALSLGSVAKRLKIQPPSLYNHVDGLEKLRRALSLHALRVLGEVAGRAAIGKSGEEALLSMAFALRELALKRPGLYAATVRAHSQSDKEAVAAAQAAMAPFQAVLSSFGLNGADAVHALRAFRSALHGFVSLESTGGFGLPVNLDASYRYLLGGITGFIRDQRGKRAEMPTKPSARR